nr:hypothetical protein [Dokdonella immobilis]
MVTPFSFEGTAIALIFAFFLDVAGAAVVVSVTEDLLFLERGVVDLPEGAGLLTVFFAEADAGGTRFATALPAALAGFAGFADLAGFAGGATFFALAAFTGVLTLAEAVGFFAAGAGFFGAAAFFDADFATTGLAFAAGLALDLAAFTAGLAFGLAALLALAMALPDFALALGFCLDFAISVLTL